MNMPILTQFGNSEQSMTSLEIAELCQKRHDNVKRLIENLINQQVIACPQIEVVQKKPTIEFTMLRCMSLLANKAN